MEDRKKFDDVTTKSSSEAMGTSGGGTAHTMRPNIEGIDIYEVIGQGRFGVVYRAYDRGLDRWVAVKALHLAKPTPEDLAFIQREAKLAGRLHHPNIVSIHNFCPYTQPPCFIMEWVDGVPLDRAVEGMDYRRKAAIFAKIARAVAYAHDMNVVHRDLKPGNILVDRAGEPRILDFGLARGLEQSKSAGSSIGGTPLYMAPEQVLAPESVGPSADIYALGLILYQIITGAKPPEPEDKSQLVAWVKRRLVLPREINPGIPEPLQRICLKACEEAPADRYPTARHLAEDLDRFLSGQPIAARPKAYDSMLETRVRAHLDDLALWEGDGLITRRERDAMEHRYVRLSGLDTLWAPGSRWLRWGPTLALLGGWLLVISALLWPLFYWDDLSSWQRVVAVGVPTFIVNLVGILMWHRSQRLISVIALAVGIVLLPIFLVVFFSEFDIMEIESGPGYELFVPLFTNYQVVTALTFMFLYSRAILARTGLALFATMTTISGLLLYAACLLLFGLKKELMEEDFAFVACWFWPLVACLYAIAWRVDRARQEYFAAPPLCAAGMLTVGILCVLAWDVPKSWWYVHDDNWRAVARCILFIFTALVYYGIATIHDRSKSRLRRMAGHWFYGIVPPFLVIPLHWLEWPLRELQVKILILFRIPCKGTVSDVYVTEILVLAACLTLIALAVRLQWRWYLYYGLIHFAVKLILFTGQHMQDYLRWPLAILLVGGITMIAGIVIESHFAKKTVTPASTRGHDAKGEPTG